MGSLPQLSILKGPQKLLKPNYLHKIFETNLINREIGDKPALIYNDSDKQENNEQVTTYMQLNTMANRLARKILNLIKTNQSIPNGDGDWIIGVCMTPSDSLITTLLSIWKSGAAYLPFDKNFPPNRIEHILNESQPALIICDDDVDQNLFNGSNIVSFSQLRNNLEGLSDENIEIKDNLTAGENDLCLVLYTSGSTGIPKGVRLPHAVVLNRLQWQWECFPYSSTEKIGVFKTALTFVDSVSELWGPLLNDMAILVVPKVITQDPERLVTVLENYKIERLVLVPTLLRSLLMYLSLQSSKKYLYNLKNWICSGETLSVTLAKEFFDYFEEGVHILCNFYGSTEIMGDVTYFVCESKSQLKLLDKIPIGRPVNNTVIYLLDGDYRPVNSGAVGELFVSGLNLANGYVNKRDPDRFVENPLAVDPMYCKIYRTGDFASISDGEVVYEGRTDSQIKIRGHRVDLSEVEKNLLSHPAIEKGVVLCYHAGEIDQALLAFVTVGERSFIQSGLQVEEYLKDKLADYMIPQVIVVDQIPLLINGKIDRQSLLKLYESTNNNDDSNLELDFDYTGVSDSQMDVAKDLFETIGKVIGRSTRHTLSATSNFYELGGNSLNSIFTVTQLRTKGHFISITDFIGAKDLGEILMKICAAQSENQNDIELDMMPATTCSLNLHVQPLAIEHKNDTIEIITSSFYEKADLEQWLKPDIMRTDYGDILELIWESLIEKDLSFIIKDDQNRSIGVALNFDAHDEPEVIVNNKLLIVFEFLEYLEGPIRDQRLPVGKNNVLHSFMMGTNIELNAQENISCMHFMENEVLKLAIRKNFTGILTTNTNPLTQQLGSNIYGYKTMLDYQVNQYVAPNGDRPFSGAPDSQRAIVHWKDITGL